jgi:hypothetical protein
MGCSQQLWFSLGALVFEMLHLDKALAAHSPPFITTRACRHRI